MEPVVPTITCSQCKQKLDIQGYEFTQLKSKVRYRITITPHVCENVKSVMPGRGFDPCRHFPGDTDDRQPIVPPGNHPLQEGDVR